MSGAMSLPQRLALVKYLTDALKALRADDLLPQSAREMPSGARLPVWFGGRLAGWASMPQPSKKAAYVSDERKLLAWAEKNHPAKVQPVTEVAVDDDLLAFLAGHYPQALRTSRRVDPQWVSDICGALAGSGHYITAEGEKLTADEIPGVTLPPADPPSPRVTLEDDAQAAIMAAWQSGDIDVAGMLALPAGQDAEPVR
jgi:hypothetical protein